MPAALFLTAALWPSWDVLRAQVSPPEDDEYVSNVIGEIGRKRTRQGETLSFIVASPSAPDPNVRVEASDLPPGAAFTNLGDGYGEFTWTPVTGQEGAYYTTFTDVVTGKAPSAGETSLILVGGYPLSHGFYRIPYDDNESFRVSQDHVTHNPPVKEDWRSLAYGPTQSIPIVAAADGRIRSIADHNTVCCADGANGINCSACNNSVWIEHANGEWTKYSHFKTGSVTGAAGLDTNECVVQGQLLGYEGDVGHTSGGGALNRPQTVCGQPLVDTTLKCGIHLHWEVRMTSQNSELRVPILCGVDGGIAYQNDTLIAVPCDPFACVAGIVIPPQVIGGASIGVSKASVSVTSQAEHIGSVSRAYFAGDHITLAPGFAARTGTYFHAMIKSCEDGTNGCPPE